MPNSPSSAARFTISVGNSSRSSASAAAGATTLLGERSHRGAELFLLGREVEVHGSEA